MLRLELWESTTAPEKVEICLVKMDDGLLQRLTIDFPKPSILFLLLQLRDFVGLDIPWNCLLGLLVCFYLLLQEVVVDESNSTKVLLKQLFLSGVRI